jgi:hypothetical protein
MPTRQRYFTLAHAGTLALRVVVAMVILAGLLTVSALTL